MQIKIKLNLLQRLTAHAAHLVIWVYMFFYVNIMCGIRAFAQLVNGILAQSMLFYFHILCICWLHGYLLLLVACTFFQSVTCVMLINYITRVKTTSYVSDLDNRR